MPLRQLGTTTVKKRCHRLAPRLAAASSSRGISTACITASTGRSMNGKREQHVTDQNEQPAVAQAGETGRTAE